MLRLQSISHAFGPQVVLRDATLEVGPQERVGLVGPNGSGKTTLLRIAAGQLAPDDGTIGWPRDATIGYLPQDGLSFADLELYRCVREVRQDLVALAARREALLVALEGGAPQAARLAAQLDDTEAQFALRGGHRWDADVAAVLRGLGFARERWREPCASFSGGWQMRIALARLLVLRPSFLLLDEPTNHLDLETRTWLERYLDDYPYAVMVVSHDRALLDRVVDRIAALEGPSLVSYSGNFAQYELQRAARQVRLSAEQTQRAREIAHIQQFIERFRYKASKAVQVQSRVKQLAKLPPVEVPRAARSIHMRFPPAPRCGEVVLRVSGLSKSYGPQHVLAGVDLTVQRGWRVAVVGPNGAGKSTLLRLLARREPADGGLVEPGHLVTSAYFAQDQLGELDAGRTVLGELMAAATHATPQILRDLAGAFLFGGAAVDKPVGVLSGGERNRLALLKVLLAGANLLILDEPTNHLDLGSKDALLDALADYGGTVLVVSHDRAFVDRLATHVLAVGGGQAQLYPESFEDFLWRKARELGHDEPRVPGVPAPDLWLLGGLLPAGPDESGVDGQRVEARGEARSRGEEYRQRVRAERRVERLRAEIEALLAAIEERERQMHDTRAEMERRGSDLPRLQALQARLDGLAAEVEERYARWQALGEELAALAVTDT